MSEHFILVLVAGTSLVTIAAGLVAFRLPLRGLGPAAAKTLEAIGLTILFCIFNLALGAGFLLLGRLLTRQFLSLYHANDLSLVVCSLLQALVFQRWREARPGLPPAMPLRPGRPGM